MRSTTISRVAAMWMADRERMRPYAEAGPDADANPIPPDLDVARVEITVSGELDLHTLSHLHARLERVLSLRPKRISPIRDWRTVTMPRAD